MDGLRGFTRGACSSPVAEDSLLDARIAIRAKELCHRPWKVRTLNMMSLV